MPSDKPAPRRPRIKDPDRFIFDEGTKEGREQMQREVLTFLEDKYMNQEISRDSVEAQAILTVVRELSAHVKSLNAS